MNRDGVLLCQEVDGGFGDDLFAASGHGRGSDDTNDINIWVIDKRFKDKGGIVLERTKKDNTHDGSISTLSILYVVSPRVPGYIEVNRFFDVWIKLWFLIHWGCGGRGSLRQN